VTFDQPAPAVSNDGRPCWRWGAPCARPVRHGS